MNVLINYGTLMKNGQHISGECLIILFVWVALWAAHSESRIESAYSFLLTMWAVGLGAKEHSELISPLRYY